MLKYRGLNTPSLENITVTPMENTSVGMEIENPDKPDQIYLLWGVSSAYLIKEFNIRIKAKLYLDNLENNSKFNSSEYKEAYNYYIKRQFFITPVDFENKNKYIVDFTIFDNIYRELSEDLIYILLNLILANNILGNYKLEESLNNENQFFKILENIIQDHYIEYKERYIYLNNLRWYICNNYLSIYDLKITNNI